MTVDIATIPIVKKSISGYVGFNNLPSQIHRKQSKNGFNFTLLLVGESGLGKTTFVNTLFNTSLLTPKTHEVPSDDFLKKTIQIFDHTSDLEENGVKLKLTVVDTPGFGDSLNNQDSWIGILENVESRYDSYLEQELKVNRQNIVDTRIHACLYFISPSGHSLSTLDIEFMKRLSGRVNIIPVIAKSDTLTEEELAGFKTRIMEDIITHKIQIFQPITDPNDDPESKKEAQEISAKIPFAIVGSTLTFDVGGKKVRGRKYPWGVIQVDNEEHCDFIKLRQMLIRSYMEELRQHTTMVLYENYRTEKLNKTGGMTGLVGRQSDSAALAKLEQNKAAHEQKMVKMEAEMRGVFQQKVSEKEAKLKQSETELYARHKEMKSQLEKQKTELEDRIKRLDGSRSSTPSGERSGWRNPLFK